MVTELQAENWRSGMQLLTAYFETDERRSALTADVLMAAVREQGIDAVVGAAMGLQGIAALLVQLLAAASGQRHEDVLQSVARGFETLAGEEGV